jgi:hypothetical protein
MPLRFTIPLQEAMTPELSRKIARAYQEFPELMGPQILVGITKRRGLDGYAVRQDFCIRLYVTRRTAPSFYTIGHEFTHLLQKPGLGTVPNGEVQCDIWTLARSELFLDEVPTYLDVGARTKENWKHDAGAVGDLCRRAIEVRRTTRNYIVWLNGMFERRYGTPSDLT